MRKFIKKQLKNERGLTLVELLAVIVILAIVSIIAFVFIGGIIENSKKDAHISNAINAIEAVKIYEASSGELEDDKITIKDLQGKNYLDEKILNPWTKDDYEDLDKAEIFKGTEDNAGEFKITFEVDGCKINEESEQDLVKKDRKELCEE